MSTMSLISRLFAKQIAEVCFKTASVTCQVQPKRCQWNLVKVPKPNINGTYFRKVIHYKDEYTVEPLQVTHLGGRDPATGRIAAKGIGGGVKHKYHWIKWVRDGPTDLNEPPRLQKVLAIFTDGHRTAHVALTGSGNELQYILATENMKVGDILKTHRGLPKNPVRAAEGDAFPLGALPKGTIVHCVEKYPGKGGFLIHAAGTFGVIVKRDGTDRVVVKMPSKREFSLHVSCMATVGRISNAIHASIPLGSPQKSRELGNRPRSGLWHRKTGRLGRKIKPPPPTRKVGVGVDEKAPIELLSLNDLRLNKVDQEFK